MLGKYTLPVYSHAAMIRRSPRFESLILVLRSLMV